MGSSRTATAGSCSTCATPSGVTPTAAALSPLRCWTTSRAGGRRSAGRERVRTDRASRWPCTTGRPTRRAFVVSGEAALVVEGEERHLRAWDFVHCPPGTSTWSWVQETDPASWSRSAPASTTGSPGLSASRPTSARSGTVRASMRTRWTGRRVLLRSRPRAGRVPRRLASRLAARRHDQPNPNNGGEEPRPWLPRGRRRAGKWSASARAGGACCVP